MRSPLLLCLMALWLVSGCAGTPKDFDVVARNWDDNGFPSNPKWGAQAARNTKPNPKVSCPWDSDSDNPADWTSSPQHPNCTSFPVTFTGGTFCGPHVNFETVTYEGNVWWDKKSFWDDDYDLNMTRADEALYSTIADRVHIEFDSDETVDNWDDTHSWWDRFHHSGVDDSQASARAMIDGTWAIVVGKLNLDTSHDAKTEVHPVYAMFVHLKDVKPGLSSWAFFVRNWGNEGFCSDDDQPLKTYQNKIKIRIPNVAGLVSDNVSEGAQDSDDLAAMQAEMQPSGDGVLMTFHLLPPDKQSWFVGDLVFVARPPQVLGAATTQVAPAKEQESRAADEPEERLDPSLQALDAGIQKLPADARRDLDAQLQHLTVRKKAVPAKVTVLFEPASTTGTRSSAAAQVAASTSPRTSGESPVALRREKKVEFVRKYLEQRGVN